MKVTLKDLYEPQLKRLEKLSLIYGNSGNKSTYGNHQLLATLLNIKDVEEDFLEVLISEIKFYQQDISNECIGEVLATLVDNSNTLPEINF